ncbi:MAG: type II toxin-antitoxin system prevent-host-death family antitoxin [Acidobacteriota bacterium]|nr:type II toxin-antitoxin system prevent-host-death family antitoxin [Acidobacteriota bacterium]
MTKTVSISEAQSQLQGLLALTRNGDEVIIEENGEPLARLVPIEKPKEQKQRTAGLGKGTVWMSDDFDEELAGER